MPRFYPQPFFVLCRESQQFEVSVTKIGNLIAIPWGIQELNPAHFYYHIWNIICSLPFVKTRALECIVCVPFVIIVQKI